MSTFSLWFLSYGFWGLVKRYLKDLLTEINEAPQEIELCETQEELNIGDSDFLDQKTRLGMVLFYEGGLKSS